MKVVGYDTSKLHTNNIVKAMLESVNGNFLPIADFNKNGLADADLIIISGILRGTGLVYKDCVKQNKNFLFIDHAYFNKGYDYPTWMRITKNRHVFGPSLTNRPNDRFEQFKHKHQLNPWRGGTGEYVLVLPPTNAIEWLFDAQDWLGNTIEQVKKYTNRKIKIRAKPEDPIVDNKGNLIELRKNKIELSLEEDIKNAYAVVVYNSNAVIDVVKAGVPVICSQNCAAYPISFKMEDLANNFKYEPNRQQLFNDLAYGQFTLEEMKSGLPYRLT